MKSLIYFMAFMVLLASKSWGISCGGSGSTIIDETWSQTSATGYPAWSGSSSYASQTWQIVQGTGQSIVSASSAPGSGWDDADVLKVPVESTNIEMTTFGAMQSIPSGTAFHLCFEFAFDASTYSTFNTFMATQYYGGGIDQALQFGFYNAGGHCAVQGGTINFNCSDNTHYDVDLYCNGSSSTVTVNGTQQGTTFTCGSYIWSAPIITGNSTGADIFIGHIHAQLASGSAYPNCLPPPLALMDGAGSPSGTVTQAQLNAATIGGNAQGSSTNTWTLNSTSGISFVWDAVGQAFEASLPVCGSSYAGNNNESIEMEVTTGSGANGSVQTEMYSTFSAIQMGFGFEFNTTGNGTTVLDIAAQEPAGSNGNNAQITYASSEYQILFENDSTGNSNPVSPTTALSQNTWYFLTWTLNGTGSNHLYLYSFPACSELGSAATNGTDTVFTPGGVVYIIGKTGSETLTHSANVIYENIVFDVTGTMTQSQMCSAAAGRCLACDLSEVFGDMMERGF